MKTITIPERFGYPTVGIIANGKEYTLNSGVEITVEDHLAEIIENAIALTPKYRSVSDSGSDNNYLPSYIDGSLTDITAVMLKGATKIGRYMFGHSRITSIVIPDSVVAFEQYAFYNCTSLGSVTLPSGITELPQEAFVNCKSLKAIVLPDKVKSISTSVFANCNVLASVYLPETPPTLANVNAFQNINPACVFYCKTQASLDAYKAATNWSTLTGTYSFVVE